MPTSITILWTPHVEHRNLRGGQGGAELADDELAQEILDLFGAELRVGADQLAQQLLRAADAAAAEATGAFVNPDPIYLQSTGFVLDPNGRVLVSVYSSGAIGRLVPDDVVGLIQYLKALH